MAKVDKRMGDRSAAEKTLAEEVLLEARGDVIFALIALSSSLSAPTCFSTAVCVATPAWWMAVTSASFAFLFADTCASLPSYSPL